MIELLHHNWTNAESEFEPSPTYISIKKKMKKTTSDQISCMPCLPAKFSCRATLSPQIGKCINQQTEQLTGTQPWSGKKREENDVWWCVPLTSGYKYIMQCCLRNSQVRDRAAFCLLKISGFDEQRITGSFPWWRCHQNQHRNQLHTHVHDLLPSPLLPSQGKDQERVAVPFTSMGPGKRNWYHLSDRAFSIRIYST